MSPPNFKFIWVRASFLIASLEIKNTKISDLWDCGTKYGISLCKTIKMVITQHKWDIYMCSLFLLCFQQEACVSRSTSEGRWKEEGPLQTSSPRPAADSERKLKQIKCQSQRQPACTCDSHVQATGSNSPHVLKSPARSTEHSLPISQFFTVSLKQSEATRQEVSLTWDEVLKTLSVHFAESPLSHRLLPVGWGWILKSHIHCSTTT